MEAVNTFIEVITNIDELKSFKEAYLKDLEVERLRNKGKIIQ